MEEKKYEAIVEAILFTMGESVELERIAKTLELDTERTKKIIEHLMRAMRMMASALRSWNWTVLIRCVRRAKCMNIW